MLLVGLLLLSSPAGPIGNASAETVTKFSNDSTEWTVNFEDQGILSDASFRVPVDAKVINASFGVSGLTYKDSNPSAVRVFIGSIDDKVYEWAGDTHGAMGYQTLLSGGGGRGRVVFESAGSDSSLGIRLPDGAKVKDGELRVTGLLYDGGWDGAQALTMTEGSNVVPIDLGYYSTPQLIDIDGDGDLDISSGGYLSGGGGQTRWLFMIKNTGSSTSPKWEFANSFYSMGTGSGIYYPRPRLVDIDGDNDHDLVLSSYGYPSSTLRLYWNTGSDTSPSWSQPNMTMFQGIDYYWMSTDFADMDGDGDKDMAIGRYDAGGESTVGIQAFRNDYASGQYSWVSTNFFSGITTDYYSYPALVDFDSDGDNDIFVGYYNGTFGYFENTGSSTSPSWTHRPKMQGNIDVGIMASPTLGDLDGDGYLDLLFGAYDGFLYWCRNLRMYPENPRLDVGADGDNEWSYTGKLSTSVVASGLGPELDANNKGSISYTDNWGNKFHDVKLKFTTSSSGILAVGDVKVHYDYTARTKDFAEVLNDYIYQNKDKADANGMLKVPIVVASGSKGAVKLSGLSITLDRAPVWTNIPSTFAIDEDTKNDRLIDLTTYVKDDYDPVQHLAFEVVENSMKGTIGVYITDGRYLGVDALTGEANDNWNGKVTVGLRVTDRSGLASKSNLFQVEVRPVNDAPTLSGDPPKTTLEDATYEYRFVANDVDGERPVFSVVGPPGMTISERGVLTWTPTNDDVGIHNITVFVTDAAGEKASITWILEVINVNDPPVLKLPGEVTVTEGKQFTLDLKGTVTDVDNPLSDITMGVTAKSPFITFDTGTWVVKMLFPKESGWTEDALIVTAKDRESTATGTIKVTIIQVKKLSLIGVPDQNGVEEDKWTLDLKPYLYNVEDWNSIAISTSSSFVTVSGTKLNFHYPRGALPELKEVVKITARQGNEEAYDDIVVTLLELGYNLLLSPVPDQYIVENETTKLDITPYIKNYAELGDVRVDVEGSDYVKVDGRTLTFLYPLYYVSQHGAEQTITVTIREGRFRFTRDVVVHIADGKYDFYLAQIPDITVTETVPETFNIKPYIKNAFSLDYIDATTDSPYADVNRFDIRLIYPAGFTGDAEVRDDLVRVTITDGLHTFTRAVTVHVHRLGKVLQMSGIGDRTVFEDTDLVIDVEQFLYNVDDISKVTLEVSSAYAEVSGLVVTLRYPATSSIDVDTVTFTAREGSDVASETINVYIERVPVDEFVFGDIGSLTVTEDKPYKLDLVPYLKNMAPGTTYKVGTRSTHATVSGFVVTLLYPDGPMTETLYLNVTGSNGDFREQNVFVNVKAFNDPPVLVKQMTPQINVKQGEAPVIINLTDYFTDVDTDVLNITVSDNAKAVVTIMDGKAYIEYKSGAPRPDDVAGARLVAFDPDDPSSRTESNTFNITFYKADEKPPPGPDDSWISSIGGGWGGVAIMLLVLIGCGGAAWVIFRRRQRVQRYGPEPPMSAFR